MSEETDNVIAKFKSIGRDIAAFQIEVLSRKPQDFSRPRQSAQVMEGATPLRTLPSHFPRVAPKTLEEPAQPVLYTMDLYWRAESVWEGDWDTTLPPHFYGPYDFPPLAAPSAESFFGTFSFYIGESQFALPAYFDLKTDDHGTFGTHWYEDQQLRVASATPALPLPRDLIVTFSIELCDYATDTPSGTFLTGAYTVPADGSWGPSVRLDAPNGYRAHGIGTDTGTISFA